MKTREDKVAWGISFSTYALLLFLKQLGVLSVLPAGWANNLTEWRSLLFYIAIAFLFAKKEKTTGLLFLVIALVVQFNQVYRYLQWIEAWWYPILFLVLGSTFLYQGLFKNK